MPAFRRLRITTALVECNIKSGTQFLQSRYSINTVFVAKKNVRDE